jgi:hypothetical protein
MATFLVLAAFELEGIAKLPPARKDAVYRRIAVELGKLGLRRVLHSKKRHNRIDLPESFYAGEFEKGEPFHTSTELREHLTRKVKKSVCKTHPQATIFLAVSRRWAWRHSVKKGRLVDPSKARRQGAPKRTRTARKQAASRVNPRRTRAA